MPERPRATYLSPPDLYRLDAACVPLREAFGTPYLVGSVLRRRDFRDVDVRLLLQDDDFDRQFPSSARLKVLNAAVSALLRDATGLPVDFQFQRQAEANALHGGPRSALGCVEFMRAEDRA